MKKAYEKPAILFTEKLTARTVACSKADQACQNTGGPIADS
jgi:hypothetical protein